MGIKVFPRAGLQVEGATSVEIDHTGDSIALGDGTHLLTFLDPLEDGTWAIPVQPIGGGDASASNQTSGAQKTQITDTNMTDSAEIDDVGGEKALKVSVIAQVGGGGGGTAATDEASFTSGASQFTPIGGQYDANGSEDLADGEMGMVRMTAERALHVEFQNTSLAVTGTFWQTTQPVSGTVAVTGVATAANQSTIIGHVDGIESSLSTLAGYVDGLEGYLDGVEASLTALEGYTDGIETLLGGTLDVEIQNASLAVTGTFWQATQPVSLASVPTHAVTQSGTWNIGSITTLPSISLAASSNNIGDVDVASLPSLPAGTNNIGDVDVASIAAGTNHIGIVTPVVARTSSGRQGTTISSSTSETTIVTASASVYHDLTLLMITNTSSTALRVDIREDTGQTVVFSVAIAANGGAVIPFPVPLAQSNTNDNWTAQCSASVDSIRILACFATRT